MNIEKRNDYLELIKNQCKNLLNLKINEFSKSKEFMYRIIQKDLLNIEIYEMSEPYSSSTLAMITTDNLSKLTSSYNNQDKNGFIEIVIDLDINSNRNIISISKINNLSILNEAIKKNINILPVKITWNNSPKINGLGIWSLTNIKDLPNNIYSYDKKIILNNVIVPTIYMELINLPIDELNIVQSSFDSISSVINMSSRISDNPLGNNAYEWAIKAKEKELLNIITDKEKYLKSISYVIKYQNENNKSNFI